MLAGRVQSRNELRLITRLVLAATDDAGRFEVEFRESEPCIHVVRIQLHRALKFSANLASEACRGEEICAIRLFAVYASQPQMETAVLGIESNRFSA